MHQLPSTSSFAALRIAAAFLAITITTVTIPNFFVQAAPVAAEIIAPVAWVGTSQASFTLLRVLA